MSSNRLLARLSRADLNLLERNLEPIELQDRQQLHPRNRRIDHVYFLESGIASVVANGGGSSLEIGIVGREGITGVSLVMGVNDRPRHDTFIQVKGEGHRLSASHLREAMEARSTLHQVFLQYAYAFMTQMADTALSNGRHKIEERLARWLLLADDRLDNHEVPLTHEFLGVMLGTARPGGHDRAAGTGASRSDHASAGHCKRDRPAGFDQKLERRLCGTEMTAYHF